MKAERVIDEARTSVHNEYGGAIGKALSEVVTPALILDLNAAQRNVAYMAGRMEELPSEIRPHIKAHKSLELARLQVEAGATGLSMATVWEAATLAAAGFDDLFVINTVTGQSQIRTLARLAREHRILVAVDDTGNAEALGMAAREARAIIGVVLEVDTGMDRAGVDSEEAAVTLAHHLIEIPGVSFEGLTGYEGHCSLTTDRDERARKQKAAMEFFIGVADRLTEEGIEVPIRSAGGTATWEWTASIPGITEIQAGSYVVMDNIHWEMVPAFERALTVAATVISRPPSRVIVDAGGKSVAATELVTMKGYDLPIVRFDEEHGIFARDGDAPCLGEFVELIPGYAPSTVNMYDAYHVVKDGTVVDVWPVVPRGPGHHGLAQ